MNVRLIATIVVALGLCIGIVFGVLQMTDNNSDVDAIIESAGIELTQKGFVEVERTIQVDIVNLEVMTPILEGEELKGIKDKLYSLYGEFLPELVEVNIDLTRYYQIENELILQRFGKENLQSFQRLYNKVVKVPDYQLCSLVINEETLSIDEEHIYFELTASYDDAMMMDYYVTINRLNLELVLE